MKDRGNIPAPIHTNEMMPSTAAAAAGGGAAATPSSIRHGRFSPTNYQQQQQTTAAASSPSVRFDQNTANNNNNGSYSNNNTSNYSGSNTNQRNDYSPNFLFEPSENIHHSLNSNSSTTTTTDDHLPTEAQLTLLCLDYLRSLRRSYQYKSDMKLGEGLDADYIALACWALNRAFVPSTGNGGSGGGDSEGGVNKEGGNGVDNNNMVGGGGSSKLQFNLPKVSTTTIDAKKNKEQIIHMIGGGGITGNDDDCVGNDSFYRLVKGNDEGGDGGNNVDGTINITPPREMFALTNNIRLPSMQDITNEVLLSYGSTNKKNKKSNVGDDDEEEEFPIYEQNDMHLSNSHRFYLFNGMASGDDSMGLAKIGGGGGGFGSSSNGSAIDGGPLTLCDLTTVALSTLNAKSRIEAERMVVSDPLFETFIKAAGSKGFFHEKKQVVRDDDGGLLGPEEEERRQKMLYEAKYRKVVAKFRSKLAVREEQSMVNGVGGGGSGSGVWSPRSAQRALANVHSVSDRLEMRRDRIIEQVKCHRVVEEDDAPYQPQYLGGSYGGGAVAASVRNHYATSVTTAMERMIPDRVESSKQNDSMMMEEEKVLFGERAAQKGKFTSLMYDAMEQLATPRTPRQPPVDSPQSPPRSKSLPESVLLPNPPSPDKAARMEPKSPAANLPFYHEAERLNTQGNELMQKKQFKEALDLYTAALKISPAGPNSHVYYSNRSAAHLSLGDIEFCIQDSELALTIRPDYAKAHSRLGLAHYASGRYEEAVFRYEKALSLQPGNEWAKTQYEKARKMLDEIQVEEEKKKKASSPGDGEKDDWPTIALSLSQTYSPRDAVRQADEFKDNANAFMKNKKYEEALHQYNMAIDTSPDGPNSHIYFSNRAAAYCYLGQYADAAEDCLKSIELNDSYEKAYARYGLSLFFLGDYQGSINAYRKSLDLAPDNKASLSYLAKAKARLAEQQENEMHEKMATKLNLGKRQESLGVANEELDEEIKQAGHGNAGGAMSVELSQSRDDEGDGIQATPFDPFDTSEGDEI